MPSPVLASKSTISWHIYRSGHGSNGRAVGPNQKGSDRGPDCPHSIWGKEVRGRVQEGEAGLGVCKDSQGYEWASGVILGHHSRA